MGAVGDLSTGPHVGAHWATSPDPEPLCNTALAQQDACAWDY